MRCPKVRLVVVVKAVAVDLAGAVAVSKVVAADVVAVSKAVAADVVAESKAVAADVVVESGNAQRLSEPNHLRFLKIDFGETLRRSDRGRFLRDPAPFLCAFTDAILSLSAGIDLQQAVNESVRVTDQCLVR